MRALVSIGIGRRAALAVAGLALLGGCGRSASAGRYRQAVTALRAGSSADYYSHVIALAHLSPDERAGRRARAILCSGSGPLDELVARAQAPAASSAWFSPSGPAAAAAKGPGEAADADFGVPSSAPAAEVRQVLGELAKVQTSFHAKHQRYCRDFVECPLNLPARPHYFYFLSERAVAGGSDSQMTVESEPDIRAWMQAQKIRPFSGPRSYLVVAVGLLGQSRVDVWTLNHHGQIEPLGGRPSP